jgi:hypothetical protein
MVVIIAFLIFGMTRMTIRQRQIRRGSIQPMDTKHENYTLVMVIWSFMLLMAILAILEDFGVGVSRLFPQ